MARSIVAIVIIVVAVTMAAQVTEADPECNLNKLVSKCLGALYDPRLKPSMTCCEEIKEAIEDNKDCMCKYLYSNCGDKFPGLFNAVSVCKAPVKCFE